MNTVPEAFDALPTVYAVRDKYVIIVPVKAPVLMWAIVGGEEYYDDSNGILRSASLTHKIEVPMAALDAERGYKIAYRKVKERKPYYSEVGEIEYYDSKFRPVEGDCIRVYHVADAHNRVNGPSMAGGYFGDKLDLLILNGDIPEDSGSIGNFTTIHKIASNITGGELPVIFSRGNHDTRGIYAEAIADHTPTDGGNSYFTFRVGALWGIVLDCGEDKPDGNAEYGHTVACHAFRLRQTRFLERVAAEREYDAEGVKYKLVVAHNPFTQRLNPPFDIEPELFTKWSRLLKDFVKPDLILCGHIHRCYFSEVGGENDSYGQPCTVMVASIPGKGESYVGGALTFTPEGIKAAFTNEKRETLEERFIEK